MGIARKKRLLSAAFFRYPKNYLFLFNPYDFFLPPLVTEGLQSLSLLSCRLWLMYAPEASYAGARMGHKKLVRAPS
jgi:hypothetical protein